MSADTVGEMLGLGNSEASRVIPEAMKIEAQSLEDWVAQLKRLGETQKASLFQSMRAARSMRLVSMQIPKEWFGGKNNLEDMVSIGVRGIGRANIVQLSVLNEKASALFSESVSKEFLLWIQTKSGNAGIRAAIAIPEIQKTTATDHRTELGKSLAQLSKELQKQNVAVLWSVEDENMLPAEVNQSAPTHINVILGSDVSVRPEDGKGYRVQLHPGLSERVR